MFFFSKRLQKQNNRGMAQLMFKDVSDDPWDKENLTKGNLDFTRESIKIIDQYIQNLMNTENGKELLINHFEIFVHRIGAYLGEVIKDQLDYDFHWYEEKAVRQHTVTLDKFPASSMFEHDVLYSKKTEKVIVPMLEVANYLQGSSRYIQLSDYVAEVTKKYEHIGNVYKS